MFRFGNTAVALEGEVLEPSHARERHFCFTVQECIKVIGIGIWIHGTSGIGQALDPRRQTRYESRIAGEGDDA